MFAVVVTFVIKPGQFEAFLPLIRANADRSLADEPGCHRFDILTDADHADTIALYELYDDAAAFDAHLQSPHFKVFDTASADMIADKTVTTWREVYP